MKDLNFMILFAFNYEEIDSNFYSFELFRYYMYQ